MIAFNRAAADRYAAEYRDKPTPARAANAAQYLAPALAEIDRLLLLLADRNLGNPGRHYLTEQGIAATEQVAERLAAEKADRAKPTGNLRARNRPRIDLADTEEL